MVIFMHDPPKSETSPDFLHHRHQQHQHQHQHQLRPQRHPHSTHLPDIDEEQQTDTRLDHTVLDNRSIAATTTTGMASIYGQRPDTAFTENHSFMSAAHPTWQEVPQTGEPMPFTSMHQQQSFDQYHHSEHPPSTWSHQPQSQPQPQPQSSLNSTPQSAVFGAYPTDPSVKAEDSFNNHHPELPQHALSASTAPEHNPYATSATSPQSENGWISTSSSDPADKQLKREQHSPLFIDNPPRLRPDGVRKKNARFEIPEERKVDTIDKIILQTDPSDEKLLKELKQQKRLLRNRQAALDSRCRKKEHTQKLEDERKNLHAIIESMDEELGHRRQQEMMWLAERQNWQIRVDQLNMEKEDLVHKHTVETAELRKKNNFLMEDSQRRMSTSAVQSSNGYSSTFSEFDHLSMNDSPTTWEDFSFLGHPAMEPEMPKPETAVAVRPKEEKPTFKEEDKSAVSGLLLTLLLCGAWVASKGASNTTMPQMPDDVRAASSTVLDNIYKDAGLHLSPNSNGDNAVLKSNAPRQTPNYMAPYSHQTNNPFVPFSHLTAPTRQQQRDEVFSLTPTQYNAMTTDESLYAPQASTQPRRNLHDALTAMRGNSNKGSAADAYTKSLMWDEVPANVVRDFARLVGERSAQPLS